MQPCRGRRTLPPDPFLRAPLRRERSSHSVVLAGHCIPSFHRGVLRPTPVNPNYGFVPAIRTTVLPLAGCGPARRRPAPSETKEQTKERAPMRTRLTERLGIEHPVML